MEDGILVGGELDRVEVGVRIAGVSCGLFLANMNRGTELPVETLALLAERRLELGLDIYAHGPE